MEFYIERGEIALSEDVLRLMNRSYSEMERKEFFAFYPETDGPELLKLEGYLYKAREKESGDLAAIIYLAFPHSENPIAKDIEIDEKELGQLKCAVTKREYRGHGLMKALMLRAEEDAKREGITYLSATVHPENHPSRDNMVKLGYKRAKTEEMYGGLIRDIMLKKL